MAIWLYLGEFWNQFGMQIAKTPNITIGNILKGEKNYFENMLIFMICKSIDNKNAKYAYVENPNVKIGYLYGKAMP